MNHPAELEAWDRRHRGRGETPAIPAATVVLLRDRPGGRFETLLLRKRSEISFGGMWVFPGGQIDQADHRDAESILDAARAAAVREAAEESGLVLTPRELVHFAFWQPPPTTPRRFATWFFVTRVASGQTVVIDDGEIIDHAWVPPREALRRQDRGEIEVAPPTWVTLRTVAEFDDIDSALRGLGHRRPRDYTTRMATDGDRVIAMWMGDAGYESGDPALAGPRHRLEMTPDGYRFDESGYRDPA